MKLTINTQAAKQAKQMDARDIPIGTLFTDRDNDLYVRVEGGAVTFLPDSGDSEIMAVYSNSELEDHNEFEFLFDCTPVKGDIKIKVTLT